MKYTSRGLRRRGDSDKWEVTLTYDDPYSGEAIRTYHTIEPKTESSIRTLPLTTRTWSHLNALKKDMLRTLAEIRRREKSVA